MANTITAMPLNRGLDLVTPPLQIESGALIDCLNYELTDIAGYRRVDGYERYDGFSGGGIYEYFQIILTAVVPGAQTLIAPGDVVVLDRGTEPRREIGIIAGDAPGGTGFDSFYVAPYGSYTQFIPEPDDVYTVITAQDLGVVVVPTSAPVPGRDTALSAASYLDAIRSMSAVLRAEVQDAPAPIAGMYWFEDRLLTAVNALTIDVFWPSASAQPITGQRLRWNGVIYRLVEMTLVEAGATNHYEFYLLPIDTHATVDDQLTHINLAGGLGVTYNADVTGTGDPRTADTEYANLGYYNNAQTSLMRGFTYLTPATYFNFDAGSWAGGGLPPITLMDGADADNIYYVEGAGGVVIKVRLDAVTEVDGSFASGTAEGFAQVTLLEVIAGTRDYIIDNDILHSEYPFTASSDVLVVNGDGLLAALAGTAALNREGTRYMWGTFNFFGQSSSLSAFGVNGAGRGFWANENGYGMIVVMEDDSLDKPKYVSFHGNRLVYGYKRGSIMLSVPGEAYNWSGFNGAIEIGTGDDITGLLEMPGDTLAVFGKRSIRKITGQTEADIQLTTISGTTGCFDYTAVMIGQNAVFSTHNGITTLEQTAAYGDFIGQRISDPVSTWLRPKLVRNRPGFELGGTVCAYPVRGKSQYRLVLETGDIVVATFTSDGPKITIINHGFTDTPRIPYALSSEIGADGIERLHCRWTEEGLESRAYQLDLGWGYDGETFIHYFDTAHLFNSNSGFNMGVEKVRLYGQGYGVASLSVKSAGIEDDFFQEYPETVQDLSVPPQVELLYDRMKPITSIIDLANWGLGIKLRIQGKAEENSTLTEPPHICQVLVLHVRTEGAKD